MGFWFELCTFHSFLIEKMKILRVIIMLLAGWGLGTGSYVNAQNGCIEIERVLVAACGASGSNTEGFNEMALFKVGPNPVQLSNLLVAWPTTYMGNFYNFTGLIQDATTAAKVAEINNTINSCGYLKEPVGGVIPANSKVIFFTSQLVSATYNSFQNLTDTLIAIFQNNTNRTGGHFLNYSAFSEGTDEDVQSLIISFGSGCSDTTTYLRSNLIKNNGEIGNEPGASVIFSPNGTPEYIHEGCTAPFTPYDASWMNPGPLCGGNDTINLNDLVTGAKGGTWSGTGVVDSMLYLTGLTGDITIKYKVTSPNNCPAIPADSVSKVVTILPEANAAWTNPGILCSRLGTFDMNTLVTGTPGGNWSGWNVNQAGIWTMTGLTGQFPVNYFVGSGTCRDTLLQKVTLVFAPKLTVSGDLNYCFGEQMQELTSNPATGGTITWYADSALTQQVQSGSTFTPSAESASYYAVQVIDGCPSEARKIDVKVVNMNFVPVVAEPDTGNAPLTVQVSGAADEIADCQWFYNDSLIEYSGQGQFTFTEAGSYKLKMVCQTPEGCRDSSEVVVLVIDAKLEVEIPNVFTPNQDGTNDLFTIKHKGVKTFSALVYNRWGAKIYEWNDPNGGWDGTRNGSKPIDGVYFYVINGTDLSDKPFDFKGTVQLVNAGAN